MLSNYLKIALRTLRKARGYAFINIAGLGLGLAAALMILLYAQHELTYDRSHEHADRIYQVYKERVTPTDTQVTRDTWTPLAERLQQEYPSVVNAARQWAGQQWVQRGDARFEELVTYTDASLFEVFTFPLAQGDAATVFADPFSVVLSPAMARKYFGETDPVGQTLTIDHDTDYRVTGVLADLPSNLTFDIDLAVPLRSTPDYDAMMGNWDSSFLTTYILLEDGADPAELEAQFPALVAGIWDAEEAARTNFKLEALPDLYDALTGNRQYAYILLGLALAILLIACINFTNLATAQSLQRVREIGMRKVLGARRPQLAAQFLGESVVMSLVALVVGVALTELSLPFFNDLYGLELGLGYLTQPLLVPLLLALGLGVGLLAGAYPALFIAGFRPIGAMQGLGRRGRGGRALRSGLVVTQFTLAAALIMGTLVVRDQLQYMQNADLRFDKEHVLALAVQPGDFADPETAAARLETFKQELAQVPQVASVASSSHVPGAWDGWFTFAFPGEGTDADRLRMRLSFMDDRYFDTYGVTFVEGRPFDRERATDPDEAIILNTSALAAFGWTTGVGKVVRTGGRERAVIGVVEDYHYEGLQNEIAPVLHAYRPPDSGVHNFISVRLHPGDTDAALAALETAWQQLGTNRPLPYTFVDDRFGALYEAEQRLGTVAGFFMGLAVLIACLGLFGLAAWTVTQRVKEVGIRKVLGASASGIVLLLSRDFARLVLIAVVLAVPLAYFGMQAWLDGFAYRVPMHWTLFVYAAVAALAVALLTVSYQALRVALTDPAKSLRYE